MPPRKRMRMSQAPASPSAESHASTAETNSKPTDEEILNDPWTDEEEIGLFKALIRWKPTGIHKHFRMLQLHEYLLDNHYIHPKSEHTKITGIWQKLGTLYDLSALDQREDARQLSDLSDDDESDDKEDDDAEDDAYSLAANKIHKDSFSLPEDEYGEQMWAHRLPAEANRDESPPALPELNLATEAPISFTPTLEIPEEVLSPTAKKRGRPPKTAARPARPSVAATAKRRSRRGASSVEADSEKASEEEHEETAEEGEEDNEASEDEDEAAESSEGEASATKGRSSRAKTRGTTRGRPKGRRR